MIKAKDKKLEKEIGRLGKTSQVPFDPKSKGRKKGSLKISGKRVSLTVRTERTKVLVSPVGLRSVRRREQWAGG